MLGDTHLTSPNISGVVNTSAIASSDVLTLKGTNELEIYQGDNKVIDVVNGRIILSPSNKRIVPLANQTYSLGDWNLKWSEIITVSTNSWTYSGSQMNIDEFIYPNKDNKAVLGNNSKIFKELYCYNIKDATSTFTPTEARTAIDKINSLYCHNISIQGTTNDNNNFSLSFTLTTTSSTKISGTDWETISNTLAGIVGTTEINCSGIVVGVNAPIYQVKLDAPDKIDAITCIDADRTINTFTIQDNVYQIK